MNQFIKSVICLFILLNSAFILGQVQVTFSVDSRPTPQISEWENRNELAILTVTNTSEKDDGLEYKIDAKIYIDGTLIAETRLGDMPILSLPFGTETFFADAIIPYNALTIHDVEASRKTITRTGLLPAGFYTFCVRLIDMQGNVISSPQESCRQMVITDYQKPELIYPINEIEIPSNLAPSIIFRWSPISPPPSGQDGIKYLLAVTEVQQKQSPSQAFLSNYPIIEEEIMGANQFYFPLDISLPDNEDIQLVWSVKPMMLNDTPYYTENNGFVPIGVFNIKNNNPFSNDGFTVLTDIPLMELADEQIDDTPGTLGEDELIYAGLNGEFEIQVTELNETDSTYTGKGTAYINWLKARVEVKFQGITVNADKRLLTGTIIAETYEEVPNYPQEWALEAGLNNPWTNNAVSQLVNWVESSGVNLPYNGMEEYVNPVKMPLGVNLNSGNQVAITEIVFKSNKSEMNVVVAKTTPPSWGEEQLIGFKASEIDFRPNFIDTKANRIEIVDDLSINNIFSNLSLTFKKSGEDSTVNPGCYIEWENEEFTEFGIELDAQFSRDWVIPIPDDGTSKTSLTLATVASNWDDLIVSGSFPKSEIVGAGGIAVFANEITYDMSDTSNASNIVFPEDYAETSELFRGFFAKNVEITLPSAWEVSEGVQPEIAAQNLIIDNMGISMKADVRNIMDFKEVSIVDLTASINHFIVEIQANELVEASISGKLALPLSDPSINENLLDYNALFHMAQNRAEEDYFQLTVTPGTINVDLFKGTMNLDETSNITAYVDKNKKTFNIDLDGEYVWANVDLGNTIGEVSLDMNFEDININYDSSKSNDKLTFDAGSWTFASPQKMLAGFPITIENIAYRKLPSSGNTWLKGSLDFDVVLDLSENVAARTSLGIESSINDKRSDNGFIFSPKFDKASIASAEVHANTPAVKIDGELLFRNDNDPVFGRGFKGDIQANFKPVGITTTALVEFGKTNHLNSGVDYRYWRVEADAILPSPGVAFLPGLAFRGFGGGAFKNMEPKLENSKYVFTPKKSSWGLRAKAIIATTPKEEIFNADVDLLGQFSGNDGIEQIGFGGSFWVGAGFDSREDAQVNGDMNINYNFPQKHLQFSTQIDFTSRAISANNVGFEFDLNGRSNKWFFKFGDPTNLNTVRINGIGEVNEYLMVGNDIPTPQGFSNNFSERYTNVLGHAPSFSVGSGGVDTNARTGKGFAFGANFGFDTNGEVKIWQGSSNRPRKVYLYYDVAAGAELNLSLMQYTGSCAGFSPMGINGWRANGNIGLYATAEAGVKAYQKDGDEYSWSPFRIASIKTGAWVQGQFPRPSYVAGRLEGNVSVLGIKIPFDVRFQTGEQCNSGTVDLGEAITQGNALDDIEDSLIQYINPSQDRDFPINSPLAIKYAFTPGEVFEVTEQQADGTILIRTFKMVINNNLEFYNRNSSHYQNVETIVNTNSLGEYLITTPQRADPLFTADDIAENIETQFDVTDMGIVTMESGIEGPAEVGSVNSGFSTVYPVVLPAANYNIPSNATFGNGAPITNGGVGGGIPNIGNFRGNGPDPINDETILDYYKKASTKFTKTIQSNAEVNNLLYKTLYRLVAEARLLELKNGNWNTEIYSNSITKEFWTEDDPNQVSEDTSPRKKI